MVGDGIRNLDFANRSRLNFAELGKMLPGAISPTDIDCAIELKGEFFFVESKRHTIALPRGQQIFFQQLLNKLRGRSVIVFFAHDSSGPTVCPVRDCIATRAMLWSEELGRAVLTDYNFQRTVGDELKDWLKWVKV